MNELKFIFNIIINQISIVNSKYNTLTEYNGLVEIQWLLIFLMITLMMMMLIYLLIWCLNVWTKQSFYDLMNEWMDEWKKH